MRWTEALIPTLKEDPQDAEVISHKLMVRGGFIRKLFSGAYSYLPLGVRVLHKIEAIIREEMDSKGAQEVLLPAIHPPDLWKKTGRYDLLGQVLIKFKDRHDRELVLGPTHEEIITDLVANNVRSYKNLPIILYQIQTKFRDEPRPRFGVMRTSEFIMKDAYSFDCDLDGLEKSYQKMYAAYCMIYERCGLPYIPVQADTGIMGGSSSHEFMVPSEAGEDTIVVCKHCKYAASSEVAKCPDVSIKAHTHKAAISTPMEVKTPGVSAIDKVASMLKVKTSEIIKTLVYKADNAIVALLLRGDYEANEAKLKSYLSVKTLELADEKTIRAMSAAPIGFSGPIGLKGVRIVADYSLRDMDDCVAGANKPDTHLLHVSPGRDFALSEFGDFRTITTSDKCPSCGNAIEIKRAIEIGHTFKLGTKYSESLGANFLDKDGKERPAVMGCYGIGVNRIASSLIESSNDANGIVWTPAIAPYRVLLIALNMDDEKVRGLAEHAYASLVAAGIDVLFDDRHESAGVKFKDGDLIGIPIKVIVGSKNAKNDILEMKMRKTAVVTNIPAGDIVSAIQHAIV